MVLPQANYILIPHYAMPQILVTLVNTIKTIWVEQLKAGLAYFLLSKNLLTESSCMKMGPAHKEDITLSKLNK